MQRKRKIAITKAATKYCSFYCLTATDCYYYCVLQMQFENVFFNAIIYSNKLKIHYLYLYSLQEKIYK